LKVARLMQGLPLRILRVLLIAVLVVGGAFAGGVTWYHAPAAKVVNAILARLVAFAITCVVTFAPQ
jgi:hypothetical protein